jgi:putative membrane protein
MVLYDLILESVAPLLGMWRFVDGTAPLKNYIAWFFLSLVFHSLLKFSGIKIINRVAPLIFTVQLLFFLLLMIIFKFQ